MEFFYPAFAKTSNLYENTKKDLATTFSKTLSINMLNWCQMSKTEKSSGFRRG